VHLKAVEGAEKKFGKDFNSISGETLAGFQQKTSSSSRGQIEIIFDASNIAKKNSMQKIPKFRNLLLAIDYYRINKRIWVVLDKSLLSEFQEKNRADYDAFEKFMKNDFVEPLPDYDIEANSLIFKIALQYPASKIVTCDTFKEFRETPPKSVSLEKMQKELRYLSQDELKRIRGEILSKKERIIKFSISNDTFIPFEYQATSLPN
jgi:Zc3h12a-like Ribonuclease NYN domain